MYSTNPTMRLLRLQRTTISGKMSRSSDDEGSPLDEEKAFLSDQAHDDDSNIRKAPVSLSRKFWICAAVNTISTAAIVGDE